MSDKNPNAVMNSIIHDGLRRDLARLNSVLQQPLSAERRAAVCAHIPWLLGYLHHHHVAEDEGIWPRVLAKRPDLRSMADDVAAEHDLIVEGSRVLAEAAERYSREESDDARLALLAAVEAMQLAALPHLDREESEVTPVTVEVLDEEDWAWLDKNYFRKGMSMKDLGQAGMWFLDDLDPQRAAVFRDQVPGPVLWGLTMVYGPRYDRAATQRWGALAGTRA